MKTYIGIHDFFCFFLQEKVLKCPNKYRCAFIYVNAFMNALRYICFFEFNRNSSAESYVNSTLQL